MRTNTQRLLSSLSCSCPNPKCFGHIFSRRLFTLKLQQMEQPQVPHVSWGSAWQGNSTGSCLLLTQGPQDSASFLQRMALWQETSHSSRGGTKGHGMKGGTDISVYSCVLFSSPRSPCPTQAHVLHKRHSQGLTGNVPQGTTAN